MDASLGVKGAMAGSQCTNAAQMQIQTCTFVLGDNFNGLVFLWHRREGKGEMHEQLAVIASLAQDEEHVDMYSTAFGNPISRDFCVNLYVNSAMEFESSELYLTISVFEASSSFMPEPDRWNPLY